MVLVEPGSGNVANLGNDIVADLLGKLKDRGLGVGVKQERQEGLVLSNCVQMKEGVEMRVGAGKGGPVAAGVGGSNFEPSALPSGEVKEGSRGVGQAARHSAVTTAVT